MHLNHIVEDLSVSNKMVYFIYYLLNCFNLDFYELWLRKKLHCLAKNIISPVIKSRCNWRTLCNICSCCFILERFYGVGGAKSNDGVSQLEAFSISLIIKSHQLVGSLSH